MKQITAYTFDELDKSIQEKVLDRFADINVDYDWWDCTEDDLHRVGLKLKSFGLDQNRHCSLKFQEDSYAIANNILKEHGDTCETYALAKEYIYDHDDAIDTAERDENGDFLDVDKLDGRLDDLDRQFLEDLQKAYANILQQECDYLTSTEAIVETIRANEYQFTEEGILV